MQTKSRVLLPITTSVVALLAMSACTRDKAPSVERARLARDSRADLVIAAAWPWSSKREAGFGSGLAMAIDEVNASGGVLGRKLRIEQVDDHGAVDDGELVAQRIAAEPNVIGVIGHLQSYVSVPAASIYDAAGLVMLAPATTDPELTSHGYRHVFRETFTHRVVGEEMARFAQTKGYKRIAIYYVRDTYGRGLANAFEQEAGRLGLSIAARGAYDPSDDVTAQGFTTLITTVRPLDVDAIFIAGEVPTAGALIAALRTAGVKAPILGGDAMSSDALIQSAGSAAEGTVVASMFSPDEPRAEVQQFATAFQQKYGTAPDAAAALGYDAVRLFAEAIRTAHSAVPEDVARTLHDLRDWRGVTGSFTFDRSGDPIRKPVVRLVVSHGRFEYYGSTAPLRAASR